MIDHPSLLKVFLSVNFSLKWRVHISEEIQHCTPLHQTIMFSQWFGPVSGSGKAEVLERVRLGCGWCKILALAACNLPCCPAGSCLQSPAAAWCTLSNTDQRTTLQAAPCTNCREYNVDGSGPTQHNIKVFPNFWLLSVMWTRSDWRLN